MKKKVDVPKKRLISWLCLQLHDKKIDTHDNKSYCRVLYFCLAVANVGVIGVHAARLSSDLALQGEYSRSRGVALMHQRLAWRSW